MSITAAPERALNLAGSIMKGRYRPNAISSVSRDVVVYTGEEVRYGRPMALEVLRDDAAADPEFVAAVRERATALAISTHVHRGLPRVYECGTTDAGDLFIALEPTRGVTLREVLDTRGALDPTTALHIASQVGEALETLHHSKLVHGALAPESVLIVKDLDGTERIMLLGVELTAAYQTPSGRRRRDPSFAAYLAPEQRDGGEATEESDQYALAVLLRELLSGSSRDVSDADTGTPPDIVRIIATALETQPERRFPDISVMVNDLWAAQTSLAEPAPRPRAVEPRASSRRRPRERRPAVTLRIAAAVATAGIIAAVVWLALSGAMASRVRALFTTPAVTAIPTAPVSQESVPVPAVLSVPVSMPAPPPAVREPPSTVRGPQSSKKAGSADALGHPSAAPRPDAGVVAERSAPEQASADGGDGGAIIDWLLNRRR